ncbi:MAG: flagellar hook-length control protein FliK [Chloroflexi bacterium]|nr:flagellar hook-length control protein FliK [Chloroflexota bacterium]
MTVSMIALPAPPATPAPKPAPKLRREDSPAEGTFAKILRRKDEETSQVEQEGAMAAGQAAATNPTQNPPEPPASGGEAQAAPAAEQPSGISGGANAEPSVQAAAAIAASQESKPADSAAASAVTATAQSTFEAAPPQGQTSVSTNAGDTLAEAVKTATPPKIVTPGEPPSPEGATKQIDAIQAGDQPVIDAPQALQTRQAPSQPATQTALQPTPGAAETAPPLHAIKSGSSQVSDTQSEQNLSATIRSASHAESGVQSPPLAMRPDPLLTSEPARLAEAHSTGLLRQLGDQVQALVKTGSNSFRMQLYPEDLGHIELRLTTGHSGLGVTLIADQGSTGRLLETQLDALRHSLAQAGIQLNSLNVGSESLLRQNPGEQQTPANPGQWLSVAPPKQEPAPEVVQKHWSPVPTSGIDYRI